MIIQIKENIFLGFDDWTNSIWTSGNDLGEQGQFTCVSTGKHISHQLLLNENVNNQNHGVCMIEHCLELVRKSSNLFIYNDDLCSKLRYFLCEERVVSEATYKVPAIEHTSENNLLLSGDVLTTSTPYSEEQEEEEKNDEYNDGTEERILPVWWPHNQVK